MNNLENIGIYDNYIINFDKWWNYITKDLSDFYYLFTALTNKIGVSCINNSLNYKLRLIISLNSLEFYKELEYIIKIIFKCYYKKDFYIYSNFCYYNFNKKDNANEYYINIIQHFINDLNEIDILNDDINLISDSKNNKNFNEPLFNSNNNLLTK